MSSCDYLLYLSFSFHYFLFALTKSNLYSASHGIIFSADIYRLICESIWSCHLFSSCSWVKHSVLCNYICSCNISNTVLFLKILYYRSKIGQIWNVYLIDISTAITHFISINHPSLFFHPIRDVVKMLLSKKIRSALFIFITKALGHRAINNSWVVTNCKRRRCKISTRRRRNQVQNRWKLKNASELTFRARTSEKCLHPWNVLYWEIKRSRKVKLL